MVTEMQKRLNIALLVNKFSGNFWVETRSAILILKRKKKKVLMATKLEEKIFFAASLTVDIIHITDGHTGP